MGLIQKFGGLGSWTKRSGWRSNEQHCSETFCTVTTHKLQWFNDLVLSFLFFDKDPNSLRSHSRHFKLSQRLTGLQCLLWIWAAISEKNLQVLWGTLARISNDYYRPRDLYFVSKLLIAERKIFPHDNITESLKSWGFNLFKQIWA